MFTNVIRPLAPYGINLLSNSDMSVCTGLPLIRVGSSIAITSMANAVTGALAVTQFLCAASVVGHTAGVTAGKLFFVEGNTAPRVPLVAESGSVADLGGGYGNVLTATAGTPFSALIAGNVMQITGGTNASSRSFYRVLSIAGAGASVTVYGINAAPLVAEGTVTYSLTFYQGPSAGINANLNGLPAAGDPINLTVAGYPLCCTQSVSGSFYGSLGGSVANMGASSAAIAWETTTGDDTGLSGNAADSWSKSTTLRAYRMYQYEWDGTTGITKPGCAWAWKFVKGSSGTELVYTVPSQNSTMNSSAGLLNPSASNSERFCGKQVVFGMYVWVVSGTATVFIATDSGQTTSSVIAAGSGYQWVELAIIVPTTNRNVYCGVNQMGSVGNQIYITQPQMSFGATIGDGFYQRYTGEFFFATHPNFPRNWVNATNAASVYIRIYQESIGAVPPGIRAIGCGFEGRNTIAATAASPAAAFLSNVASTEVVTPTIYQPQASSLVNFSSAATAIPAANAFIVGSCWTAGGADAPVNFPVPFDCTLRNLYATASTAPVGAETFTYILRKNAAATALTSVTTGAAVSSNDTTNSVLCSAGDLLSMSVNTSAGAAPAQHNITVECVRTPIAGAPTIAVYGIVPVGQVVETDGSLFLTETLYFLAINAGWQNDNIDMNMCIL